MKRVFYLSLTLFVALTSIICHNAFPWDNEVTHRDLSGFAADFSVLSLSKGNYLSKIGFKEGLSEFLKWGSSERTVKKWLHEGAYREDEGNLWEMKFNTARFNNHFHNPLRAAVNWNIAGLDDYVSIPPFFVFGESALLWAQDGIRQSDFRNSQSEWDWSWQTIRMYFYRALTSVTDAERQEYFARTFRGLGHQMHLIQDMAVPAHVRNDAHPLDSMMKWVGTYLFESWAAKK
ncbi:MAG: hypothetical protein WC291_01120 [Thermodesulfovibrionales bacterium]|jgi:hypothetical protein